MHKGRPYPFHFVYWVTRFLFWPFRAGRRIVVFADQIRFDDWDAIEFGVEILSDVGVISADRSEIKYHFNNASVDGQSYIRYYDASAPPVTAGKAEVYLLLLSGEWARAELDIAFADNPEYYHEFTLTTKSAGFDSSFGALVWLTHDYATYAQGGNT